MKNNNAAVGIILIFLGAAYFLRNFGISVINTMILFGGLYFLYEFSQKRNQPHLMFGTILTGAGAVMLLRDLRLLDFDISGELFLIGLGLIFLVVYFYKGITGFVFPGFILPALGLFTLLENNFNARYMWPSLFILLGLAFYMIYFTAFIHKSSWPLIPGTILILFGLAAYTFVLGIVSVDMLALLGQYQNYIIPGAIVLLGAALLYKGFKK